MNSLDSLNDLREANLANVNRHMPLFLLILLTKFIILNWKLNKVLEFFVWIFLNVLLTQIGF